MRKLSGGRRASTDRGGGAGAAAAAAELSEQVELLQAQVEQWRSHGKLLSDSVRSLQKDLAEERKSKAVLQQLLHAQEEKIKLLESMHGLQQSAAAHQRQPSPQQRLPSPQAAEAPQWLKWPLDASGAKKLFGWLGPQPPAAPSGVLPSSPGHRTLTPSAVSPSRGPAGASTPRPAFTKPSASSPPKSPPRVSDWAGAHTAAKRLHEQLASGGTPRHDGRSVEHFLESFLTAVAPPSPLSAAGARAAKFAADPTSACLSEEAAAQTASVAAREVDGGGSCRDSADAGGGGGSTGRDSTALVPGSATLTERRGVEVHVVTLGAAMEPDVSMQAPSPPVTTRIRSAPGSRTTGEPRGLLSSQGTCSSFTATSSEATTCRSCASSRLAAHVYDG